MNHFIITSILIALAAKAKAQANDKLLLPEERRVKSEMKTGIPKRKESDKKNRAINFRPLKDHENC
jgi:hypothetical protein